MAGEGGAMRLLNDMSPEELREHEGGKRFCMRCSRAERTRLHREVSTVIWNGDTLLPPRRFVNAKIQVIAETWVCDFCQKSDPRDPTKGVGLLMDFEHIGAPGEIVSL